MEILHLIIKCLGLIIMAASVVCVYDARKLTNKFFRNLRRKLSNKNIQNSRNNTILDFRSCSYMGIILQLGTDLNVKIQKNIK